MSPALNAKKATCWSANHVEAKFSTRVNALPQLQVCRLERANHKACPKCDWPMLSIKTTKHSGTQHVCPQKDCDYSIQIQAPDED